MRNWIIVALITLLCIGSASAAFVTTEFTRSPDQVASVAGLSGIYNGACARFDWDDVSDEDFNTFVVRVSSNASGFSLDLNQTTSSYNACTIKPGEWVKVTVFRVDGNADGFYLNQFPDANVTVNPGTVTQAGTFFMYNILVAVGGLAALIVLTAVIVIFYKKSGFKFKV